VVVALAYRTLSIPIAIVGLMIEHVRIRMTPALVLVATALWVVNLALSVRVARGGLPPWLSSWRLFTADAMTAVLANVWAATLVSHGALLGSGRDPFTPYVVGGTALWTALRGSGTGLVMVIGATSMEFGMLGANHAPFGKTGLIVVAVRVLWISSAWAAGWLVRSFASRGAVLVQRRGEELAREKERTRMLRTMHDTVLQTLEAVVAAAEREDQPSAPRLENIAQSAGAQAMRLRTMLRQADEATGPLYDEMAPVVERFETKTGIRSELVHLGETPELEPGQAEALLGAMGEALRNVEKHAQASRVNIFLETGEDRLRLVIKDDGCGFDPYKVRPDALGIVQSIVARLEEVGGGSNIESRPGAGTRLELWVPL
jgi:signal transduction histidine kinase